MCVCGNTHPYETSVSFLNADFDGWVLQVQFNTFIPDMLSLYVHSLVGTFSGGFFKAFLEIAWQFGKQSKRL